MSAISTGELNEQAHMMRCARLGVDDFEYDFTQTEMREVDKVATDENYAIFGDPQYKDKNFRCPVVRWKINGKWFAAAVPVKLRSVEYNFVMTWGTDWKEDHSAMEEELLELIEESRTL